MSSPLPPRIFHLLQHVSNPANTWDFDTWETILAYFIKATSTPASYTPNLTSFSTPTDVDVQRRKAFDLFLSTFPFCFGYWQQYALCEWNNGHLLTAVSIFERGVAASPTSTRLWCVYAHTLRHGTRVRPASSIPPSAMKRLLREMVEARYLSPSLHASGRDHAAAAARSGGPGGAPGGLPGGGAGGAGGLGGDDGVAFVRVDAVREVYRRGARALFGCYKSEQFWRDYLDFEQAVDRRGDGVPHVLAQAIAFAHRGLETFAATYEATKRAGSYTASQWVLPGEMEDSAASEQVRLALVLSIRDAQLEQARALKREREPFEEALARDWFHVQSLSSGELGLWHEYLDFEEAQYDQVASYGSVAATGSSIASASIANGTNRLISDAVAAAAAAAAPAGASSSAPAPQSMPPTTSSSAAAATASPKAAAMIHARDRVDVLYRRCMVVCAQYHGMWERYANWLVRTDRADVARTAWRVATSVHIKRNPFALLSNALFEESSGRVADARALFAAATERFPAHLEGWARWIAFEARHAPPTNELFERAVARMEQLQPKPDTSSLYFLQARIHLFHDDVQAARAIYERAIQAHPGNLGVWLGAVDHELRVPGPDRADRVIALYERALTAHASASAAAKLKPREFDRLWQFYVDFLQAHTTDTAKILAARTRRRQAWAKANALPLQQRGQPQHQHAHAHAQPHPQQPSATDPPATRGKRKRVFAVSSEEPTSKRSSGVASRAGEEGDGIGAGADGIDAADSTASQQQDDDTDVIMTGDASQP